MRSLPKTLDETYQKILLNIDELWCDDVWKVLWRLAFCLQPPTLEEVVEVVAVLWKTALNLTQMRDIMIPKIY